jgi:hypothetical protein
LSPEWANRRYKPEALWGYQPVKKPSEDPRTKDEHPMDALLAVKSPRRRRMRARSSAAPRLI